MAKKIEYNEISKAEVSESRNVVISHCSKGGFTVAQQLKTKEGDNVTTVFLKGAIRIDSIDGLYELRDAINFAIDEVEAESAVDDGWDY